MHISKKSIGIWKVIKQEKSGYLFVLVPLSIFVLFGIVPIIWSLVLSFMQYFPGRSYWVGLENFKDMIGDDIFWKSVKNTFVYTLGTVPGGLAAALALSNFISARQRKVQVFFKSAFYLPMVASGAILSLIWMWLFHPFFGLFNYLLSLVEAGPVFWLGDPRIALFSLMFMMLVTGQGASIILLCAAMGNIPQPLYEAARIDGSTKWSEFWHITLPLLKPTILYLLIMGTIGSFQIFTQVFIMTQGGPNYASSTLVYLIFTTAFNRFNFGKASSEALFLFALIMTLAYIQYKFLGGEVEY